MKQKFQTQFANRTRSEHQQTQDLPKGLNQPKTTVQSSIPNFTKTIRKNTINLVLSKK